MKKLIDKLIKKCKDFVLWIWSECKDWRTVVLLGIVIVAVYSPVWVCYLLYFIFKWKWSLIVATAILAFWAGPFSPFFVICISITLAIKRRIRRTVNKVESTVRKVGDKVHEVEDRAVHKVRRAKKVRQYKRRARIEAREEKEAARGETVEKE